MAELGPKATAFLILAIILGALTGIVWSIAPPLISSVTVTPTLLGQDEHGNIVQLDVPTGLLATQVSYPDVKKIQIGAKAEVELVGMESTQIQWWIDYRIQVKPEAEFSYRTYDAWQANWETDGGTLPTSGWAPYWKSWFTITGGAFDFEPNKKAWWNNNLDTWGYDHGDGWIPLDPAVYASIGDWIKWSGTSEEGEQGWSQTPAGNYDVKVSLHVKVNYKDNYGKEHCAIGPPQVRPSGIGPALKNGELIDFLVFTLNYQAGSIKISVSPKFFYRIWIPLDFAQTIQPSMLSVSDIFVSSGLPTWFPHALLSIFTVASAIATVYYYNEEQ